MSAFSLGIVLSYFPTIKDNLFFLIAKSDKTLLIVEIKKIFNFRKKIKSKIYPMFCYPIDK